MVCSWKLCHIMLVGFLVLYRSAAEKKCIWLFQLESIFLDHHMHFMVNWKVQFAYFQAQFVAWYNILFVAICMMIMEILMYLSDSISNSCLILFILIYIYFSSYDGLGGINIDAHIVIYSEVSTTNIYHKYFRRLTYIF